MQWHHIFLVWHKVLFCFDATLQMDAYYLKFNPPYLLSFLEPYILLTLYHFVCVFIKLIMKFSQMAYE